MTDAWPATDHREVSIAFQTDKLPRDYAELARTVENYGFDALSMYGDLMFQPPIVPLTLAAQATSTIRLGPASLNPFTLHPVEIAGQIATLDQVSEGRAYLGLARGAWLESLRLRQMHPVSRVSEAFEVVAHLLEDRRTYFSGRHFQLDERHRFHYPIQRSKVPFLLGSWGQRLITESANLVQEVKLGGSANPAVIPQVDAWLHEGAQRHGHQNHSVGIVLGAVTVVDTDRQVARGLIRREMAMYLPVVAGLDPTSNVDPDLLARMERLVEGGDLDGAGALIPDEIVNTFSFAGTPTDVIEQCERIFEAGASRIEFGTPHGTSASNGLKLLGEQVLPALDHWRS
ncbi:MAG: LLM class flavin-dependent oxidoreductase [Chloroflexota bacterium]